MSESVRQNNLFAAEDWTVVYTAFRNVSLQAYDYNSIYNALVSYLQTNNPDEFNDYIQNSEMMAHVNMLAYLGQTLAFRIDLNARENFFDTAERRESVINLARQLGYKPKRNRTANGLCKIDSVMTTEPILDNQGNSLSNVEVFWNQINDASWYENFINILNHAFVSFNSFGDPVNSGTVNSINTEIYSINSVPNTDVVHSFSSAINGSSYDFEVVSAILSNYNIAENYPSPTDTFNIVYQNDQRGNASNNTGFFVYFKQGTLNYIDYQYDTPKPNRIENIDVNDINQTDVWVEQINTDGSVNTVWDEVPTLVGQNIVYNNIYLNNRNIYEVDTQTNSTISIKYSDGNFGAIPVGTFRVWYRVSENTSYIIRPNDISKETIVISYVGKDNQIYSLTLKFTLYETVDNASPEETTSNIKQNAPLEYYTQDRMINGEDYNIYPLTQSNIITKLKSVNRTHAGHSRYIDITDPTGSHSNISVVANDGYLYKDYQLNTSNQVIKNNTNFNSLVYSNIETGISSYGLKNFYYHDYRKTLLSDSSQNLGGMGSTYLDYPRGRYVWKSLPKNDYNSTGYFVDTQSGDNIEIGELSSDPKLKLIRQNSVILFGNDLGQQKWVTLMNLSQSGIVNLTYSTVGTVELSDKVQDNWYIIQVIPGLRLSLNSTEISTFQNEMQNNRSFGIRYDYLNDEWILISQDNIANTDNTTFDLNAPTLPNQPDNRWLIKAIFLNQNGNKEYTFYTRGLRYIFGSDKDVRFFFKNTTKIIDPVTGKTVTDFIKILKSNSDRNNIDQSQATARAFIGHMYTSAVHNSSTKYDITNIVPVNSNYGNVKLFTNTMQEIFNWTISFDNGKTYLQINSALLPDNTVTPFKISDLVEVFDLKNVTTTLKQDYDFSFNNNFIRTDGVIDYSKILVEPIDSNSDGVPDFPLAFEDIVNVNELLFFKTYTDFSNITYDRVDNLVEILNNNVTLIEQNVVYYCVEDITINDVNGDPVSYTQGNFYIGVTDVNNIRQNKATILTNNTDSNGNKYSAYFGRMYTPDDPFFFEWQHYAGGTDRIDPSISNIIDMYVLTSSYDSSVRSWLKNKGSASTFPTPPTSNEIQNSLKAIEKNKSTSDQIIYIPAQYKLLFGETAAPEYQATFKVIKALGTNLTDNEIKSKVIDAINTFFDINNWDFGESFYFTELATYIQTQLIGNIGSVVIVPTYESSSFGNLFEIISSPNELFLSTATVNNIEIVKTYTDANLRKK